jgi:hypothetical protein
MIEHITDKRMGDDIKEVEGQEDSLMKSMGGFSFSECVPVCQGNLYIGETQVVDIKGVWASKLHGFLYTTEAIVWRVFN